MTRVMSVQDSHTQSYKHMLIKVLKLSRVRRHENGVRMQLLSQKGDQTFHMVV